MRERAEPFSPAALRVLAVLVVASLASGCSFSWDQSGIRDVLFGGRPASEIVPAATNADSAEAKAAPGKPEEKEEHRLRKIAILPVAYTDAAGGQPCDLCPPSVEMKPTSALAARLVTGFTYEAIARHPRLLFPTPEAVEKAIAAAPGRSMRQAAAQLASSGRAEVVVASALVDLRQRVGPDDAPESPAGVALYVSLVNARSGEVMWSGTFDENESGRGMMLGVYDKLINDKPVRWSTAEAFSETAVDKLIEDLVDEVN